MHPNMLFVLNPSDVFGLLIVSLIALFFVFLFLCIAVSKLFRWIETAIHNAVARVSIGSPNYVAQNRTWRHVAV